MGRILVCKDDENLMLSKSNAFQFKSIDLSALNCGSFFDIKENESSLVGVECEADDSEEPIYTLVTNEFGLYAMSSGVTAKVKVSFCDNGMMIVDVIEGAVLIKPEEEVLLASRGVQELPNVRLDNILWVDANRLLSFAQFWKGTKSKFTQDFEYVFLLKGETKNNLESFSLNCVYDDVIDISGGHIAMVEAQMKLKEEAKQAKKGFSAIMQETSASSYEFDDDDEDEEDDSDDYDYDDDDDDGSSY